MEKKENKGNEFLPLQPNTKESTSFRDSPALGLPAEISTAPFLSLCLPSDLIVKKSHSGLDRYASALELV